MSGYRFAPVALLLALAACDADTLDPRLPTPSECPGGSCDVRGVDLALSDVHFAEALEPGDPRPWAAPGDTLQVAWTVVNRGDETSPATSLVFRYAYDFYFDEHELTAQVPALAPGDTLEETTQIVLPQPLSIAAWNLFWYADSMVISVRLLDNEGDPYFANDTASLPAFTLATPMLAGRFRPLGETDSAGRPLYTTGDTVLWELVVWNESRYADAPPMELQFCSWIVSGDGGCEQPPVVFPAMPGVPAGDTVVHTVAFGFDTYASPYPFEDIWVGGDHGGGYVCSGGGDIDAYWSSQCFAWGTFRILPSFHTICGATDLPLGETRTGAQAPNCSAGGYTNDVWRLDVVAGGLYDISSQSNPVRVHAPNGAILLEDAASFVAPEIDHVYIVIASGDYTLTVTRRL